MKSVKSKACGKFILIGEHFVVPQSNGESSAPAICFPLKELQCSVSLSPSAHAHYNVELPIPEDRDIVKNMMGRAVYAASASMRVDLTVQKLSVDSKANFPISRGFGSSAAFSVALVRAFEQYRKQLIPTASDAEFEELFKATNSVEKIFHGSPSGVDAATILREKPILFQNGMIQSEVYNLACDFVLIDSGVREQCGGLVNRVKEVREQHPDRWAALSRGMRQTVNDCFESLKNQDFEKGASRVAVAVREANGVLSELGLVTEKMKKIIVEAEQHGALAGKASGAGSGGAVVLVACKGDGQRLATALKETGLQITAVVS